VNEFLSGLIFVLGISSTELQDISQDFADNYWDRGNGLELALYDHKADPNKHLVILNSPKEFYLFQFLVNYITYPMHRDYQLRPTGYWRAGPHDLPVRDHMGKMLMIFIPKSDTEYDNVYAVTDDGVAMILGFAMGYEYQPLPSNAYEFSGTSVDLTEYGDPTIVRSVSPFIRRAK
jgi:hypothetical protein